MDEPPQKRALRFWQRKMATDVATQIQMKKLLLILFLLALSSSERIFAAENWLLFSPKDEKFSITFPSAPTKEVFPDSSWSTNSIMYCHDSRLYTLCLQHRDINFNVLSSSSSNDILKSMRDVLGKSNNRKIISEKEFKFNELFGKDITYLSKNGDQQRVRMFIHKNRAYVLIAISSKNSNGSQLSEETTLRFFHSFRAKI